MGGQRKANHTGPDEYDNKAGPYFEVGRATAAEAPWGCRRRRADEDDGQGVACGQRMVVA
ncbi:MULTISPECIES: hypothetical protein [unclassified Streptomyces]|uniref:hypothetical protein n=1 Tax=unclassified Streptomyces TaxID=2593676 RepID=UPI00088FDC72|nr:MULTISPECIES: hypothetical protein [unclassified Streptomyces]PBC85887.1 hypothetical protein BX261_5918 [Streptomyces sp. 2321.6]SDR03155.1 hypothetical protein SAMN05216511_1341 [Streptomyces sp. KS_16]SED92577.1 hypothetical protein SAMN05428954_1365 [Streptomyces sp. 2112.3]SNC72768.1 hypothetical protein SAMN06272741_5846 [Streptomyces sp. 2114.4]